MNDTSNHVACSGEVLLLFQEIGLQFFLVDNKWEREQILQTVTEGGTFSFHMDFWIYSENV